MTATSLAILFHEAREKLAPFYGFDYNPGTNAFNANSHAGRFLVAVCEEVLDQVCLPAPSVHFISKEGDDFDE